MTFYNLTIKIKITIMGFEPWYTLTNYIRKPPEHYVIYEINWNAKYMNSYVEQFFFCTIL